MPCVRGHCPAGRVRGAVWGRPSRLTRRGQASHPGLPAGIALPRFRPRRGQKQRCGRGAHLGVVECLLCTSHSAGLLPTWIGGGRCVTLSPAALNWESSRGGQEEVAVKGVDTGESQWFPGKGKKRSRGNCPVPFKKQLITCWALW